MYIYAYIYVYIYILADRSSDPQLPEIKAPPAPAVTEAVELMGDDTFDTPEVESIAKDLIAIEQDPASSDTPATTQQVQ
jgi:hypothetical protein